MSATAEAVNFTVDTRAAQPPAAASEAGRPALLDKIGVTLPDVPESGARRFAISSRSTKGHSGTVPDTSASRLAMGVRLPARARPLHWWSQVRRRDGAPGCSTRCRRGRSSRSCATCCQPNLSGCRGVRLARVWGITTRRCTTCALRHDGSEPRCASLPGCSPARDVAIGHDLYQVIGLELNHPEASQSLLTLLLIHHLPSSAAPDLRVRRACRVQ